MSENLNYLRLSASCVYFEDVKSSLPQMQITKGYLRVYLNEMVERQNSYYIYLEFILSQFAIPFMFY